MSHLILASPIGVPEPVELNFGKNMGFLGRKLLAAARWGWWEASITPQSFVRGLGPWGSKPVTGYVTRRFAADEEELEIREQYKGEIPPKEVIDAHIKKQEAKNKAAASASASSSSDPSEPVDRRAGGNTAGAALELDDTLGAASKLERRAAAAGMSASSSSSSFPKPVVADYLYHICAAAGSGEFAFARLFDQSGFAYKPLIHSLPSISQGPAVGEGAPAAHRVPISFLYGSHDWMDVKAGIATSNIINAQGGRAQTLQVKKAGHQLFIDNPTDFLRAVKEAVAFAKEQ